MRCGRRRPARAAPPVNRGRAEGGRCGALALPAAWQLLRDAQSRLQLLRVRDQR